MPDSIWGDGVWGATIWGDADALWGVQELEDVLWDVLTLRHLSTAAGKQLDRLGEIVGERRTTAVDEEYRILLRIRILTNTSQGQPERIIDTALLAAGSDHVHFTTRQPAVALVYCHEPARLDWLRRVLGAVAAGVKLVLTASEDANPFVFGKDHGGSGEELTYGIGWGESGVGNEGEGGRFTELMVG